MANDGGAQGHTDPPAETEPAIKAISASTAPRYWQAPNV